MESLTLHLSCLPILSSFTPLLPHWLLDCGANISDLPIVSDPRANNLIHETRSLAANDITTKLDEVTYKYILKSVCCLIYLIFA